MRRFAIPLAIVIGVLALAGIMQVWQSVGPRDRGVALEHATSSGQSTSTPEFALPWAKTEIPWRSLQFDPPAGYWAYFSETFQIFSLTPGKAPATGDPDPQLDVYTKRVAEFYTVDLDQRSFPTWERFQITMAQLACASGDTEETLIVCSDEPTNVVHGRTVSSLPYMKFTLSSYRQKDKAPKGDHTYFMLRLGEDSTHGVLFAVQKEVTGVTPTWSLVKSMRIR